MDYNENALRPYPIYPPNIHAAVEKLHWLKFGEDGVLEIYLDNHMLQTYRSCEAKFQLEMIEGWRERGAFWFLVYGTLVHKMVEIYYRDRKAPDFNLQKWYMNTGMKLWEQFRIDEQFSKHPDYIKLGAFPGFALQMAEYANVHNVENERLRVIGTELYFGKSKEVPLLADATLYQYAPFRLYLSGKIDLLVDNGSSICPMDHKTAKDFRGKNPMDSYEIQDGMCGYVFATNAILKRIMPESTRTCNSIIMNFLQVKKEVNPADRFRRGILRKTDAQLEAYRMRMISTATKIFDFIASGRDGDWNTMMCNNFMHNVCPWHGVHRVSPDSQLIKLNATGVKQPVWDCETVDAVEEAARENARASKEATNSSGS